MVNERRSDSERGFTLVELMIVVAIIAILAGILIPNFVNARAQAQASACESNIRAIATAEELYYTDNQNYKAGSANPTDLAPPGGAGAAYLSNTPHDPSATDLTAQYTITATANNDGSPSYQITCPGSHPGNTVQKLAAAAQQGAVNGGLHKITYAAGVGFGVDAVPNH